MRKRLVSAVFVDPMLPTLVPEPPAGDGWIHEIKHDRYRTILTVDRGAARAFTRNRNDWTSSYPHIVAAAAKLACRSAIIDGEVIAQDADGRSDFHAVRTRIELGGRGLVFFAFDLLFLDGEDLTGLPLEERRLKLRKLMPRGPRSLLQFSEAIAGDGAAVFASAEQLELEGIVSKRLGSRYKSGRTDRWLKTKCFTDSDLVFLGVEKKKSGPAAALLARDVGGRLEYAGKAMITLAGADRERLRARIEKLTTARPAIAALRKSPAVWVRPELVVGVRHLRGSGGLRHATVRTINDG